MSTTARLAGFTAAAALVLGGAVLVGRVSGVDLAAAKAPAHDMGASAAAPGGLANEQDGYALELPAATAQPGPAVPVAFRITDPDGRAVTAYDVRHDKQLHLIAVRRDLTGYQHVHPTLSDGTWRTTLALSPGAWRLVADVAPKGHGALVLGADLLVPGDFAPVGSPEESSVSDVDGYRVRLTGDLRSGSLTFHVSAGGRAVTDLEPYLGAYGHLVALRAADLAYLHVHPSERTTGPGPDLAFDVEVPSPGTYHLFLDLKHHGQVRTASFVVTVPHGAEGSHEPHAHS